MGAYVKASLVAALAFCGACAPATPEGARLDSRAVAGLLDLPGDTEIYAVPYDTTACGSRFRDPGTGTCAGGMTIDHRVWLAWQPGNAWSASSLAHEACHVLHDDQDHAGPCTIEGPAMKLARAILLAHPELDAMELAK